MNSPSLSSTAWYVIHSKPRQEHIALTNLERQGFECYLPLIRAEKIRRGRAEVIFEPLFSRYLFIRLDSGDQGKSWLPIRSTLGVSQLVRFGGEPAKVDESLIQWLKEQEQTLPTEHLFKPGQRVVVTQGPFAGIEAIYQASSAEQRSMILLELLNKPVLMQIDTAALRE
jgi:transcriptional antiterminator RfaH